MGNQKHIIITIGLSAVIIGAMALLVDYRNTANTPQLLLDEYDEESDTANLLDGPLTPEEQRVTNPELSNTMNPTAIMTTNKGVIELELFEDQMPITAGNFAALAEAGFYDGIKFHRVIDGFMIQGGDPNTKNGDPATWGTGGSDNIQDEFVAGEQLTNVRGTLSMANTGQPNSGSSQFFINLVDNTNLDFDKQPLSSKHPVFARVINGMDVVDAIGKVEVAPPANVPVEPVVIESVTIERN
ncbi:peptidylprolyl isomerase [Candidatus Pacebacteria bacterium]|nr:peptidylprolyl isomerase [Candidatus Paceibacterota bacterium]